ncbi:catalase [Weeksellaceae bacterium KMM 9713]|uniref:Catalase n=1 Tax=Profundicola chukchiensis TaxID=2961959 RepID=A0A9X4MXQ5_9FLAO|nr:catalase [Profundicola chukchiensis]MDG4945934.1 catalase [Profundicola chukchiensis]
MKKDNKPTSKKIQDLEKDMKCPIDHTMTTNDGVKINDDNNSLKAGERGPSLLEDFIHREKMSHFDRERIPERVVHARGSAAHGIFELYESLEEYTKAGFLTDTSRKTPVFVRFSTVAGFRGSPDLARDIRGFSVKFYTEEGNYDLIGNNTPVFFIQDGMKFPDLVHSVKPEPDNQIPQAASAHDTFYDFVSHATETLHNHMWAMSDRAIPRSLRMMEGFGIHTFRLVNAEGKSCFVRFHWKPLLGIHGVTWEEAVKINGADSDYHRRDLWDAIEAGHYPEWELGLQIIPEEDEMKFDFDILDATKLIPEEIVPVKIVGKMTLNRNPENFFAETEQAAFHPGRVVPGIDFSDDPLLQSRLFSYHDTQIYRLGGANFNQIPINRPINEVHNNQRDGQFQTQIHKGKSSYFPNSLAGGCPHLAKMAEGGFTSVPAPVAAHKVRARSESFSDHYSQPALLFRSLQPWEQNHMVNAYSFELGKCTQQHIQERMLFQINKINEDLASKVAKNLGLKVPNSIDMPINQAIGADADGSDQPGDVKVYLEKSPALSMTHIKSDRIDARMIAVLAADGFNMKDYQSMKDHLESKNAMVKLIAPHGGTIKCDEGMEHKVDAALMTTESVLYDALFIPGGKSIDALMKEAKVFKFIDESYKYCKAIAVTDNAEDLLKNSQAKDYKEDKFIFIDGEPSDFSAAIAKHRNWDREEKAKMISV